MSELTDDDLEAIRQRGDEASRWIDGEVLDDHYSLIAEVTRLRAERDGSPRMDRWTAENLRKLAVHFGMSTDDIGEAAAGITATAAVRIRRLESERDRERERADRLEQGIRSHEFYHPDYEVPSGPTPRDRRLWALLDTDGDSDQEG